MPVAIFLGEQGLEDFKLPILNYLLLYCFKLPVAILIPPRIIRCSVDHAASLATGGAVPGALPLACYECGAVGIKSV